MTRFEQQIQNLQDRLRALPPKSIAVFSAACAERLVVVYERFTTENNWDCYSTVRGLLELSWEVLLGRESSKDELKTRSAQLLHHVPHGDDFTGIFCTGAQDFAACIESTIKWIFLTPDARYGAVYYPLEVLSAAALLRRFGKASVTESDMYANDSYFMADPAIQKEFAAQANDLAMLEKSQNVTTREIEIIKSAAVENRHNLP